VGDQDLASPPRSIFGYYRHWPGKSRIYERVATAVNAFQKLETKAKQMNKVVADNGRAPDQLQSKRLSER
jgi:hypothetical protein